MNIFGVLPLLSHVLTVALAVSYATLGIADPRDAESFWAPYAGVVVVLALLNLHFFYGTHRERR